MRKSVYISALLIIAFVMLCFLVSCDNADNPNKDNTTNLPGESTSGESTPTESSSCNHVVVIDSAVEPKCNQTGLTEGKHCSLCGEILVPQEEVPTTEHKLVNGVCSVCGYVKESKGLEYKLNEDKQTYSIVGIGSCADLQIVIPKTYQGLPVTELGKAAFSWNREITDVVLQEGMQKIGNYAFDGCNNLKKITIPYTVTSIGEYAFFECYLLETISLPANIIAINDCTFAGCKSLKIVDLPVRVTTIGMNAFKGCEKLINVSIGKNVNSLGETVFDGCSALVSVDYSGTKAEWESVSKAVAHQGNTYFSNSSLSLIHCSDGDIRTIPEFENNGLTFDDAIDRIVTNAPLYISYKVSMGNDSSEIQLYKYYGSLLYWYPQLNSLYNIDALQINTGKDTIAYDITNNVKRAWLSSSASLPSYYFFPSSAGNLTPCRYTKDGKEYDGAECVADGIRFTYLNSNNSLIGMVISDAEDESTCIYYEIQAIGIDIPADSHLTGYLDCKETSEFFCSIVSSSMTPALKAGELRVFVPVSDKNSLQVGDVIAYYSDLIGSGVKEYIVIHRIVSINYDANGEIISYVTKGDNNPVEDQEACLPQDIIGVMLTNR